jgi:phosphoribosylanthranilate isomerase
MKFKVALMLVSLLGVGLAQAQETQRIEQLNNEQVKVWQTIVYPSEKNKLVMHRHDFARVVVALTDGVFKITNDKGKTHLWTLEKNKAYYLAKDPVNELHSDENMTDHAIKVMVVELKNG